MGVAIVLFAQSASAKMTTLAFQDAASDVMMSVLQSQPEESFVKRLYTRLLFVPVWVDASGLTPYTTELFDRIKGDETLDRKGSLYQDALALDAKAQTVGDSLAEKLALEIKITDLYRRYANYTIYGSINWGAFLARLWNIKTKDIHADWIIHKPQIDPIMVLEETLLNGSFAKALDHAIPTRYHYREMQQALIRYIRIKARGAWKPLYFKGTLRPGRNYAAIPAIRERLRATGDYEPCEEEGKKHRKRFYDNCLKEAVARFKARNALFPSGLITQETRRAMNVSVEKRIATLRLNLDRIKWLQDPPPGKHIWINIPDFMLYFEEDGKPFQQIKVVVGKPNHPTPIFNDMVETIVLNPYWNIPKSIIQKEMIPKLLRNPYALRHRGIEIFKGWGDTAPINPATVDWGQYRYSKSVPFRFAQLPGRRNALGKIKFLFPNQFSVYMHDTPQKKLFKKNIRAFSHGCVRLSQPRELLKTFSGFDPNVDYEKSQQILKSRKKRYISLSQKIPVDITYLTAWIDHNGTLQFRNDIYRYDKMQLQAFREKW